MRIKYIVKSENQQGLYLVKDVPCYNKNLPYAFRHCNEKSKAAQFETKDEAISACEIARANDGADYLPTVLETIVAE